MSSCELAVSLLRRPSRERLPSADAALPFSAPAAQTAADSQAGQLQFWERTTRRQHTLRMLVRCDWCFLGGVGILVLIESRMAADSEMTNEF